MVGTGPKKKILNKLIFSNYTRRLDAKFHDEGRKVALIIDNCTAHTTVDKLEAIELVFLPANTTSKTQPMDQGVIRALKAFYHTNVVRHQIKHIDAGSYCPWMFQYPAVYCSIKFKFGLIIHLMANMRFYDFEKMRKCDLLIFGRFLMFLMASNHTFKGVIKATNSSYVVFDYLQWVVH